MRDGDAINFIAEPKEGAESLIQKFLALSTTRRMTRLLLRRNSSDCFAVTGDANGPASLHLIQKLREFRFGVRSLEFENVGHCLDPSL